MSHLSDDQLGELLTAYVDGEVDPREKAFVEHLLREDRRAAALLAELRGLSTAVAQLPRHAAPTMIADDIRQLVERDQLLAGPAFSPVGGTHHAKSRGWTGVLALAAMVGMASAAVLYFQSQQRLFENVNSPVAMNSVPAAKNQMRDAVLTPKRAEEVVRVPEPPPSEETLTRFVDQVLALAETIEKDSEIAASVVGGTSAVDRQVLSLGIKFSDHLALKGASSSVEAALRKVADGAGSTVNSVLRADASEETRRAALPSASGAGEASGTAARTWTLRVPVSQLPKFAEAVVSAGGARSRVTLATGSTKINGAAGTKEAIRRVDQAWQKQRDELAAGQRQKEEREALAAAASESSRESTSRSGGPFAELFKIIGVPEGVALLGPPAPTEPVNDNDVAPVAEDAVAAVREADADSSAGAEALEFKEDEAPKESVAKAKSTTVEQPGSKDAVAPGIVERQMKKLRESPSAPMSPAFAQPARTAPFAAAKEKYVTLVITVAVQPEDKPAAPTTSPAPAKPNGTNAPPRPSR